MKIRHNVTTEMKPKKKRGSLSANREIMLRYERFSAMDMRGEWQGFGKGFIVLFEVQVASCLLCCHASEKF